MRGGLCNLSYPIPPRILCFFWMHFVVARLTQADEIVCVIRKLRMLIRVLDVVHGRRLTAPPIPQAIPAQIAIPPQHRCSQPPPSRRVVIKAHDPASESLRSFFSASRRSVSRAAQSAYGQTTSIRKCSPVLAYVSQTQPLGRGHGRYAFLLISSLSSRAPRLALVLAPKNSTLLLPFLRPLSARPLSARPLSRRPLSRRLRWKAKAPRRIWIF